MKNVFFCWQSDIPRNRRILAGCINEAIDRVNKELRPEDRFVFDEAARDVDGSPDLDEVIAKKIARSEIVIGDVTPIGDLHGKKIPNPNVLLEVGYSGASIGWSRTVLLWDKTVASDSGLLPFDIRNRVMGGFDLSNRIAISEALYRELKKRCSRGNSVTEATWLASLKEHFFRPAMHWCLVHESCALAGAPLPARPVMPEAARLTGRSRARWASRRQSWSFWQA